MDSFLSWKTALTPRLYCNLSPPRFVLYTMLCYQTEHIEECCY
jgi:hypothetical protein